MRPFRLTAVSAAFIVALFFPVFDGLCADEDLFRSANQAYRSGQFETAAQMYESLAERYPSAAIYYNLGNSYFRAGKTGLAVLNYERARKLSPRDRDILSNLNHVKGTIEFEIKDGRPWFVRLFSAVLQYFRVEWLWILGFSAYAVFMLWLIIRTVTRKTPLWDTACAVLMALTVLAFIPLIGQYTLFGIRNQAVITAPKSEVRYGPSNADRLAFRLADGLKVQIVDEREDWCRIELVDGQSGWILKSEITRI